MTHKKRLLRLLRREPKPVPVDQAKQTMLNVRGYLEIIATYSQERATVSTARMGILAINKYLAK